MAKAKTTLTPEQKNIIAKLKLRKPLYELTSVRTLGDLEPNDIPEKDGRLTNRFTETHEDIPLTTIMDMLDKRLIVEVCPTLICGYYSKKNNTHYGVYRIYYGFPTRKFKLRGDKTQEGN